MEIAKTHPDYGMVIEEIKGNSVYLHGDHSLAVFTTDHRAAIFMTKREISGATFSVHMPWDELIDKYGQLTGICTIDHDGEAGFHTVTPLIKD